MIKAMIEKAIEYIYPTGLYCICCGKIIDDSRYYELCDDCMDNMKWAVGRCCSCCGKPLSEHNPMDSCFNCRTHSHNFDRGYCCCEYGAHERSIVFHLKYDDRTDIAAQIAKMMADRLGSIYGVKRHSREYELRNISDEYDLIVPVPVSDAKLGTRGYNQAALIAGSLSELSGIEYKGDVLRREHDTAAMKGLTPAERRANIEGCFALKRSARNDIAGMSCLIVDDIYTTGATVDETARVLKNAGAIRVDFLSFASGADVIKS